ncbi:MAG: GDSL-type esterase/lipase family protein [Nitriliruptor sp.]
MAVALAGAVTGLVVLAQRTAAQVRSLREAGARVPPLDHEVVLPGRGAPCDLAVLGDSAAAGHGLPHADLGLARQVARRLSAATGRPVHVTSVAVDGATTDDVIDRQVPTLPPDAEVVVVGVGVNDAVRGRSLATVHSSTGRLLTAVRDRAPGATVVLLTCPDLSRAPGLPSVLGPVLGVSCRRVARAQRRAAAELGIAVVGADGGLPASAFGRDGFHPGPEGVAILADRVVAVLTAT